MKRFRLVAVPLAGFLVAAALAAAPVPPKKLATLNTALRVDYDRYRDVTTVTYDAPRPGASFMPRFTAEFPGRAKSKPKAIIVLFGHQSPDWFVLHCDEVLWIADEKPLTDAKSWPVRWDGDVHDGGVRESVVTSIPFDRFKAIAKAGSASYRVCGYASPLLDADMEAARQMVEYFETP